MSDDRERPKVKIEIDYVTDWKAIQMLDFNKNNNYWVMFLFRVKLICRRIT